MTTPSPADAQHRMNAVEQARFWLAEQTGRPIPMTRSAPAPADDATRGDPRREAGGPEADAEAVARGIVLRKLAVQARTRHELNQELVKQNVTAEVAASVLDRLEEVGLVDDESFAHNWVESRQQRRHLSRAALRRELQAKGVERDQVAAALGAVDADDDLAAARALVAKKAAATWGLDPVVRRRRLSGALARRGFGAGVIATVLSGIGDRPDDGAGA